MRAILALLTAMSSAVVLAGCSAAAQPPPATQDEVTQYRAVQAENWWNLSFSGEPQPDIALIEQVPAEQWPARMVRCVANAGVAGLSLEGGGTLAQNGGSLFFDPLPGEDQLLYRAYYVCYQQYPYEISDPQGEGIYSEAQKAWLYDYLSERLAPCISSLGYPIDPAPTSEEFVAAFYNIETWSPYRSVSPGALTWKAIDARCPPPPEPFGWVHP